MDAMTKNRPLIISENELLVDDLVRISAAAGAHATVVSDAGAARGFWPRANLVLVDGEVARSAQMQQLRRRSDVVLVTYDAKSDGVWKDAVAIGAEHVVALPEGEVWLVERLAEHREEPARAGRVLCVTGVCGGAGASTFAVALASAAARLDLKVVVIAGDRGGGGLDIAFGIEDAAGMRWPEFAHVSGRLAADTMTNALPIAFGAQVLSWDRRTEIILEAEAFESVLDAATRGYDLVIVDVPRLGVVHDWVRDRIADLVVMVPTRVRAVSAALQFLRDRPPVNLAVVARAAAPLDPIDVAEVIGEPFAAVIKHDESIAKRADHGDPPGVNGRDEYSRAAMAVLASLGIAGSS